jgi:hypothetical protein
MKKIILSFAILTLLASCENVNPEFVIQLPITSDMDHKGNQDTTIRYDNLLEYPEYLENRDRINRMMLFQSSFFVEEISPAEINEEFNSIKFYLETGGKNYLIAEYLDVSVKDFFRLPQVDQVEDDVAEEISESLLNDPEFTTIAVFDRKSNDAALFENIHSKFVMVIRIELDL